MPAKGGEVMKRVASIVLAGGQGTRLHPLTKNRCKPSVCYGGKYRLIDIPISNSLNANIQQIFVISQYFTSSLHQHIEDTYHYFRQSKIKTLSPERAWPEKVLFKGTADAIRQNSECFKKTTAEYFLILSGDQLYNIDFTEMLNFSIDQDADLTIACLPVEGKEARRMGLLKIDEGGRVQSFVEKPSDPAVMKEYLYQDAAHYLGSMGIYIFKRAALFKLLKEQGDDFGKDLIPVQVQKGKTSAYVYKGYWEDIGTIGAFYDANIALTRQENCLNTYDELNPIFTHPHHLPSPLIRDTIINRSIIGQGAVIDAKEITGSVVGIRLKINKGTVIRNSVLLGSMLSQNYAVGENCLLDKVILDENCSIGNNVHLTNREQLEKYEGDGIFIRDGIIIVTSGTMVPDNFIL